MAKSTFFSYNDLLVYDPLIKEYVGEQINAGIEAAEDKVTVVTATTESDSEILAAQTGASKGDILVIKREFTSGKFSHTGYVFDGTNWCAMDGNYNAENVYISGDITVTSKIGVIDTLVNGSAKWHTDGKNVKSALQDLVGRDAQPTVTAPTAKFITYTGIASEDVEPGTTKNGTISFEVGLDSVGSYTYGPAVTGVTAVGYSINHQVDDMFAQCNKKSGTVDYSIEVGNSNKTIKVTSASVDYSAATNTAVTNFGNATELKVEAGTASIAAKTFTFTSKRKSFYAVDNNIGEALDSQHIRALANNAFGVKKSYSLAIPNGTKRVIIAVPANTTIKSCIDVDGMGLDVKDNFTKTTVSVGGADATGSGETYNIGKYAADYSVFVCENAAGLAKTTYNITLN